jgi:acetoin:2,6-dichlorophenolindophenol oxidoreductase subunit beta
MPTTPHDVKGQLIAAIRDDAPVIVFEHRWLYDILGEVPEKMYEVPLDKARLARPGRDITIAATSYMVLEALRAAEILESLGVNTEVIDVRAIAPLDIDAIIDSVAQTGLLITADTATVEFGIGAEIVAGVMESGRAALRRPPRRIGLPHSPTPTSPALVELYYPRAHGIARAGAEMLGIPAERLPPEPPPPRGWHDVPDATFTGPY